MNSSNLVHSSRRAAFTLIEVLVVVAIIALLVSILLPSLARAREQARTTQCLSQLKQMGNGINMYTTDNRSFVPGPSHMFIYIGTSAWEGIGATSGGYTQGTMWARQNLPYYIGRYMGDKRAKNMDNVATCPTAARLVKKPPSSNPWYYQLGFHYIANTGANGGGNVFLGDSFKDFTGKSVGCLNTQGKKPYYATKVPNYFGYQNLNSAATLQELKLKPESMPKKIDKIKNQSTEWAIADVWYWESAGSGRGGGSRRVGTYPFDFVTSSAENSGAFGRGEVLSYPFHLATAQYSSDLASASTIDKSDNSPRLLSGRTNAAYFDGHGGSVRKWEGTVNPCFDVNADQVCD